MPLSYNLETVNRELIANQRTDVKHNLVFGGEKKVCVMCQLQHRRTKAGWKVYSRHKCDKCDVALCRSGLMYNCFNLYHQIRPGSIIEKGNTVQAAVTGAFSTRSSNFMIPYIMPVSQSPRGIVTTSSANILPCSVQNITPENTAMGATQFPANEEDAGRMPTTNSFPFKYNFDFK